MSSKGYASNGRYRSPHDRLTYNAAKMRGEKKYLSDSPCNNGHPPGFRYVTGGDCAECKRERTRKYLAGVKKESRRVVGKALSAPWAVRIGPWDVSWGLFEDDPKCPKTEPRFRERREFAA